MLKCENSGCPVIQHGWVVMFENPRHPVIFAQLYVGFKLYFKNCWKNTGRPVILEGRRAIMFANPGHPGIFHNCLFVSKFSFPGKTPDIQ